MAWKKTLFPMWGFVLLSLVCASIFFYMDLLLPLGFAAGITYITLVLIGLWSESNKLILVNCLLGTLLTALGAYLSPESLDLTPAAFNRLLSIGTLWLTTYFCLISLRWTKEKYRGDLLEKAKMRLMEESGYVELNRDIASIANLSLCLDDAFTNSLRKICEFADWPVGHLYILKENEQTLVPSGIWYLKNKNKFNKFCSITDESRFNPGEGLPGRVMADGKVHYIEDLQNDANFPRGLIGKEIKLVSGFGFPILIGDKAVGVMEFFSSKHIKPGKRFMEVMENIGILLGRVIERAKADESNEIYNHHLRKLYHKLDSIREEESKRIARDVHDEMGQLLTTLKIELTLLDDKLVDDSCNLRDNVKMMYDLIDKNIQIVKKISQELRPPVLDSMSLTEAIEWQGKLFQDKTGIKFSLSTLPANIRIDAQRSTSLFRIFQECLTNISRHSEASNVHVEIFKKDANLVMQVQDDGKGISKEEITNSQSLGLLGMKERAHMWEGEVEFQGDNNQGTTVTIKIKY